MKRFQSPIRTAWKRNSRYIVPALFVAVGLGAGLSFWQLGTHVGRGPAPAWDEAVLRALRSPNDPGELVGPYWLQEAMLDATALGSPLVLGMCVVAAVGFLYFEGQRRVALIAAATTATGALVSSLLKQWFTRQRPDVVPHLREVLSFSFPSGHSMGAAVVYLTLGVMFMKSFRSRRAKAFSLFLAVFLTLAVGVSRVYLGVHYPSDVLGGWIAGTSWALGCWAVAQLIPNRPLPEASDVP